MTPNIPSHGSNDFTLLPIIDKYCLKCSLSFRNKFNAEALSYLFLYLHMRASKPVDLDPLERSQDKSEGSDMINVKGENPKQVSSTEKSVYCF